MTLSDDTLFTFSRLVILQGFYFRLINASYLFGSVFYNMEGRSFLYRNDSRERFL